MHSILLSLSALFRSGYLFFQSVPAKFKVSRPVIEDFAPPSSPQRWNVFSHGLPTRKASGRFSHILVHLHGSIWLCVWVGLVRIYYYSTMAPRLSGQTSLFGVVSFVSNSLMGIDLFRLYILFSQYRSCDDTQEI